MGVTTDLMLQAEIPRALHLVRQAENVKVGLLVKCINQLINANVNARSQGPIRAVNHDRVLVAS